MSVVTPALLALELGVSQKQIRDVLRSRYGLLPDGVSRWELDDAQAEAVREHLMGMVPLQHVEWALEPGDTVRRRTIHSAYGGQQQGGISTPRSIPDIMIFTDPDSGARYGYDMFEGLREDGSYAYTGEGQYGDQEFVRGNRALRDAAADGKIIRLLRTNGVYATYVGAFTIDEPPYSIETIPDADGEPRQGIIFNLVPISAQVELLPAYGGELPESGRSTGDGAQITSWNPPEFSDLVIPYTEIVSVDERVVSRVEFELQAAFGEWLTHANTPPRRLQLRAGSTIIEPDFYVPERGWIVEAKKSTARRYVRTAIGQVLDYVYVANTAGIIATPVVLLPGRPEVDLIGLMQFHGITVLVRTEDGFEQLTPA